MKPIARRSARPAVRMAVIWTVAALTTPLGSGAQTSESTPGNPPPASRFQVGQFVRLTAPGIVIDEGVVRSVAGNTLVVASQGMELAVEASLLEAISVRERRWRGPIVKSALPGVLLGVLGKAMFNKMDCRRRNCPQPGLGKGALIGGALGSAVGLVVALNSTYWRQVFP